MLRVLDRLLTGTIVVSMSLLELREDESSMLLPGEHVLRDLLICKVEKNPSLERLVWQWYPSDMDVPSHWLIECYSEFGLFRIIVPWYRKCCLAKRDLVQFHHF